MSKSEAKRTASLRGESAHIAQCRCCGSEAEAVYRKDEFLRGECPTCGPVLTIDTASDEAIKARLLS